jgi:hypothetical protein
MHMRPAFRASARSLRATAWQFAAFLRDRTAQRMIRRVRSPHFHPRHSSSVRRRLARVLYLALMLVLSNAIPGWAMAMPAGTATTHAHAAANPCHETPAPPAHPQHGSSCPCCGHGCFCLHGSAAPLPEFSNLRPLLPATAIVAGNWTVSPAPAIAKQLRPPIA